MLLHRLLSVALALPLLAGFNTDAFLGDDHLATLPPEVTLAGERLRSLLMQHPFLHFDTLPLKRWGLSELAVADHEYLPALQAFVTAAAQHPQLIGNGNFGGFPCFGHSATLLDLGWTLCHLLGFGDRFQAPRTPNKPVFNVVPEPSTPIFLFNAAKARFKALGKTAAKLFIDCKNILTGYYTPHWSVEASTFAPMIQVTLATALTGALMREIGKRGAYGNVSINNDIISQTFGDIWDDDVYCLAQRTIIEATESLPYLFGELQEAAGKLAEAQCHWTWMQSETLPWDDALKRVPLVAVRSPWGWVESPESFTRREQLILLVNQHRARLLKETVLMRLKASKAHRDSCSFGFDKIRLVNSISELLKSSLQYHLSMISVQVESLVETQRDPDASDLITKVGSLTICAKAWPKEMVVGLTAALENSYGPPDLDTIKQPDHKLLWALKGCYGLTTRLVESYATVLRLGITRYSETPQMDLFLLEFFANYSTEDHLVLTKNLMENIESMMQSLGQKVAPYDWEAFPLYTMSRSFNISGGLGPKRTNRD